MSWVRSVCMQVLLKFNHRNSIAAFLAHTIPEFPHQAVTLQVFPNRQTQRSRPLAVYNPDPVQTSQVGILQVFVQFRYGILGVFTP